MGSRRRVAIRVIVSYGLLGIVNYSFLGVVYFGFLGIVYYGFLEIVNFGLLGDNLSAGALATSFPDDMSSSLMPLNLRSAAEALGLNIALGFDGVSGVLALEAPWM